MTMEATAIERLQDEMPLVNLLRHVFWAEPTPELLRQLAASEPVAEETDVDRGLNLLVGAVRENRSRIEQYKEELDVEFAALFIGPRQPPAVPFASFYLSETATLMSDVTVDVRKRYLAAGVAVKELHSLPDDHVAAELEFIHHLMTKCVATFAAGDREGAAKAFGQFDSFTREHWALWAPKFAQQVIDSSTSDFYRGAGMMLKALVTK